MRKVCIILIALLIVSYSLSADTSSFAMINNLIESGLMKNNKQISELSYSLTSAEAMMLYNSNKMNTGMPFALNFLVGCGIGSFVQGDISGGVTGLVGELIGCSSVIGGYVALSCGMISSNEGSYNGNLMGLGTCLVIGGGLLVIGIRIYELIRPFSYANEYNKTLFGVLNNTYGTALSLTPVISPDNGFSGMIASANISF